MFIFRNPVLMLAWSLPAVAVVASLLSLAITLHNPDGELPEQYHWEGFQLDRDFSRAARATELKVHAVLLGFGSGGECALALQISAPAPESLELLVAHATQPSQDQRVKFTRTAALGRYAGPCRPAAEGHWRVELVDATDDWAVRQSIRGSLDGAVVDAVAGANE